MNELPLSASDTLPPADAGPRTVADELVIHGLLECLNRRDDAARARRIDRALVAIAEAESQPRRLRFPIAARLLLSAAALITVIAAVVLITAMSEPSALAEVRRAIDAHRAPGVGDRRYEVRVLSWDEDKPRAEPHAVMDTRGGAPGLIVVAHTPPRSKAPIIVGRDAKGMWAIRDGGQGKAGGIERDDARRYWPPWSVDEKNLLVDSIDRILEHLAGNYKLERTADVKLDAANSGARSFDRIAAARKDRAGPTPHEVTVWIDRATNLVERVEFRWDDTPTTNPPAGADGRRPHRSPRMVILNRVAAPDQPADWFTPEAHLPKPAEAK